MYSRVLCSLSLLTLAIGAAHAAEPLNTPRLVGMDNFRDIAGTTTAYSTAHNGTLRAGVFYRTNAVTPTSADMATLTSLNIGKVFDLRTPNEIAATPDRLPPGVRYQNIDIIGATTSGVDITNITFHNADEAIAMMKETNRAFVYDAGMRSQYTVLFNELAGAEGATLFHCTAGKDRTGWTAAVLQSIAGVDDATLMANYLATNDYTADRIAATLAALPPNLAAIYGPMIGVDASYLQAGLDEVKARYGTMDNYLKQGLGLSQETIYVLRGKMVRYNSLPGQASLQGNAGQAVGVGADVVHGQLHVPRRDLRRGPAQRFAVVVRPGFEHRVDQHFLQPHRHQHARVDQRVELVPCGQLEQRSNARVRRQAQVNHRLEADRLRHRTPQQDRQPLGDQPPADRHAALGMVVGKMQGPDCPLVDGQAHSGPAGRLDAVLEDDPPGAGQHEGDLILRGAKGDGAIAPVVHAAKADALVPPIDATDDDVVRQRQRVGIEVVEHPREQRTESVAAQASGAEDDLFAGRAGKHLRVTFLLFGRMGAWTLPRGHDSDVTCTLTQHAVRV